MKNNRNIRVYAVNNDRKKGFHIYLDFSGQREYLIYHRHNGHLYRLLKDGVTVEEMKRWRPSSFGCARYAHPSSNRICKVVKHLMNVIDDYMLEREAC